MRAGEDPSESGILSPSSKPMLRLTREAAHGTRSTFETPRSLAYVDLAIRPLNV